MTPMLHFNLILLSKWVLFTSLSFPKANYLDLSAFHQNRSRQARKCLNEAYLLISYRRISSNSQSSLAARCFVGK